MRVAIVTSTHYDGMEQKINEFLTTQAFDKHIVDIKYHIYQGVSSALIMYEDAPKIKYSNGLNAMSCGKEVQDED